VEPQVKIQRFSLNKIIKL